MPFSVQPSKSVVISGEDITNDDFLKIILEDGHVLYVRTERDTDNPYFANYTFDEEFLPQAIVVGITGIVKDWYKWTYLSRQIVRSNVHKKHSQLFRKKGGLRGQLRSALFASLYVYRDMNSDYNLDIGGYVRVKAGCLGCDADVFNAHDYGTHQNNYWTYPAPIAAILPTTRATIRQEIAAQ